MTTSSSRPGGQPHAAQGATLLLLATLAFPGFLNAEPGVPDDVRWALEDLYGPDRTTWPLPLVARDLDGDGVDELIAPTRGCAQLETCNVDLFLCRRSVGTECTEYCYGGSGPFRALTRTPRALRCEPTC